MPRAKPILQGTRKNVAAFEDGFASNRNVSAGAAQVKITQGIRESLELLSK